MGIIRSMKAFFSSEVSSRKRYRKPMRKEDYPTMLHEGNAIRANGLMYVVYRKLSRGRFMVRLLTDQEVGRTT